MLFFTNGSCLALSYSPDGVAGGHKFTALKPVFILDGKREGGVFVLINDLCFSATKEALDVCFFLKMYWQRKIEDRIRRLYIISCTC